MSCIVGPQTIVGDASENAKRRAMLAFEERGIGVDTLFFLHYLGGSGREWNAVGAPLEERFRCVYVDLPGFGESSAADGFGVADMASAVRAPLAARTSERGRAFDRRAIAPDYRALLASDRVSVSTRNALLQRAPGRSARRP